MLDIPYQKVRTRGIEYKIIRAVFKTIKDALLRGESVFVKDLGRFTIRTRKAHSTHRLINTPGVMGGVSGYFGIVPEKRYIHFRAASYLRKDPDAE